MERRKAEHASSMRLCVWIVMTREENAMAAKKGLYANINARKKKGISRPKSKSTISPKAYANMQAGFPKKKK